MIEQTLKGEFLEMAYTQQNHEPELLEKQNVVGVGLGHKHIGGEDTGEPAMLVLVRQKLPKGMLAEDDLVPERVEDRPTDVLEVGEIFAGDAPLAPTLAQKVLTETNGAAVRAAVGAPRPDLDMARAPLEVSPQQLATRARPVMGGYSVAHYRVTAGTIATCCYDLTPFPGIPHRYYILSNNHVLANSNNANIGDPILQPGPYDGGAYPGDVIARLSRFVPIRFRTPISSPLNYVDAAIAEVPFHLANRQIYWIGHVKDMYAAPQVGTLVQKTGRTTNYTTGRITAVNATVDVNYSGGRVARFARQILTTNMSAPGDSGSLGVDLDEQAIGLLFAGSATVTVFNSILYVQSLLRIRVHEK